MREVWLSGRASIPLKLQCKTWGVGDVACVGSFMIRTILLGGGPTRRFLQPLVDHRTFQLLESLLMP
jgi:hypothetical protein